MPQVESLEELARLQSQFAEAWKSGDPPRLESLVERCAPHLAGGAVVELLKVELRARAARGESPVAEEYLARFPQRAEAVHLAFAAVAADPGGSSGPGETDREVAADNDTGGPPPVSDRGAPHSAAGDDRTLEFSPATRSDRELATGSRVGRYRIVRRLGRGGFGAVYLAHDEDLDREVALKVIERSSSGDGEGSGARSDEGRIVAQLEHPNIAPVYDTGLTPEGQSFIVSKYIDGQPLDQRLADGPLAIDEAVRITRQVAEALALVHQHGWTHRDVKPSNIIVARDDRAVLLDFGIALDDAQRTGRAETTGTPVYMSPEQASGNVSALDGRSDLFSLGAVMYEMLTGRRAFQSSSASQAIENVLSAEPRPPSQLNPKISPQLEAVVLRCLKKQPDERFSSAGELIAALDGPPSPPASRRWVVAAAAGAAAAVIALAAFLLNRPDSPAPASPEAEAEQLLSNLRRLMDERSEREFNSQMGGPADRSPAPAMPAESGPLRFPPELQTLEARIAEARESGDEQEEFNLLLKATNELISRRQYGTAASAARRMLVVAGEAPTRKPIAYGQLGLAQYRLGMLDQAIASYEVARDSYQQFYEQLSRLPATDDTREFSSHMARMLGMTLMRIGNVQAYDGRYELAEASYREAEQLYQKHDREEEMLMLLTNFGSMESQRGRHAEAAALLQQGIQLADKLGRDQTQAELIVNLANARARAGQNQDALTLYQQADRLASEESSYQLRSALLSNWALTLLEMGQAEQAAAKVSQLRAIAEPGDTDAQRMLQLLDGR